MKLSEYVTQVINDPKYGHDIEWVKGNLHRAHIEQIEAAHDAEKRAEWEAEQGDKIRMLHAPVEVEPSDTVCRECSFQLPNGKFFGKVVDWPCPTLDALSPPVPDTTKESANG